MSGSLVLWLVPGEPARVRLDRFIADLASRLRTPPFRAHVTLLGGIALDEDDILDRARELAARLRPVPLSFPRAAHEAEHYRCVFLEAEATAAVLGARHQAARSMGREPEDFRPHLSLVYGRIDEDVRGELAHEVERALEVPLALSADRLEVVETRGAPSHWRSCGAFMLGG